MTLSDTERTSRDDAVLVELTQQRRTNHPSYGTLTRYAAIMSDGTEREIVHAQTLDRRKPSTRSTDLTIGTAPPLSMGLDGMVMHFALKMMELGLDAIVLGPERTRSDVRLGDEEVRDIAHRVSFAGTAHAAHTIADRLESETSSDMRNMLWAGVSLGAMKGIAFSAMAPVRNRTLVYGHFVVPVVPDPMPPPTSKELRRFQRSELGALMRLSTELVWHDVRDRTFRIHENVARAMGPGLMMHYARSIPRERVFRIFTEAWRDAVVSGEAGTAATNLPKDRLFTFELFDKDGGGSPRTWMPKLRDHVATGNTRVVIKHGRHTDAMRLSHQRGRADALKRIVRAVHQGVPVAELRHPLA